MTSHEETCVSELNDWNDCSTCAGPVSGAVASSLQKNREEDAQVVVNLSQGKPEKKWAKVKDLNLQARADHEEELWTDVATQRSSRRWPRCRMCVEPGGGATVSRWILNTETQGFAISTNPINCTDEKKPFFFFLQIPQNVPCLCVSHLSPAQRADEARGLRQTLPQNRTCFCHILTVLVTQTSLPRTVG